MTACRTPSEPGRFGMMGALLLLLLFAATTSELQAAVLISQYHPITRPFYDVNGSLVAAVRQYNHGDEHRFLVLDPYRFELRDMNAEKVLSAPTARDEDWQETPFSRALFRQTSSPYPLQNDGLREAEYPVRGFFLTVDLCPAKKPLDRRFIVATAALPQPSPIPVAMMISGLWIQKHESDFAWLKDHTSAGRLSITWVNHSFTHPYEAAAPLERNFLLTPKTDFASEILSLERLLLEHGLMPSPFFRFPGLVSNRQLIERLRRLSLIPIGSNAWLAKGEKARPGSILLVHGNGNEPEGIRLLLSFYAEQREAFRRGDAALLPLRKAFLPR